MPPLGVDLKGGGELECSRGGSHLDFVTMDFLQMWHFGDGILRIWGPVVSIMAWCAGEGGWKKVSLDFFVNFVANFIQ